MPPDARPAQEIANRVGIPYETLKKWYLRSLVNSWRVGRNRYVSEREVRDRWEQYTRPRYMGGPERSAQVVAAKF